MKTIDELRKGFEETKTFEDMNVRDFIVYDDEYNNYISNLEDLYIQVVAINGAWEMYQELNK